MPIERWAFLLNLFGFNGKINQDKILENRKHFVVYIITALGQNIKSLFTFFPPLQL